MIKKFHKDTDPSNILCPKCQYWMAYTHAKKVGEDYWICLECLKKNENNKTT